MIIRQVVGGQNEYKSLCSDIFPTLINNYSSNEWYTYSKALQNDFFLINHKRRIGHRSLSILSILKFFWTNLFSTQKGIRNLARVCYEYLKAMIKPFSIYMLSKKDHIKPFSLHRLSIKDHIKPLSIYRLSNKYHVEPFSWYKNLKHNQNR